MGCVCCSLSSFFSVLLDALERISLCTVCALLTCCLFFTILTILVMGIGIGYHYCVVQTSVAAIEGAAKQTAMLRSGDKSQVMRSVDKAIKRGFARRLARRNADDLPLSNNNTLNSLYPQSYNYTSYNGTENLFDGNDTLLNIINNTLYNTTNFTVTLI